LWQIDQRSQFKRQYKLLGSERQKKVDNAIRDLIISGDPANCGDYKKSMKTYAYELSKGDRIIYDINYEAKIIILLRVCDHKSVYGKD
jgi:mRNA-degrading endonuclease RelE of RelBE toxin-antitoxin system